MTPIDRCRSCVLPASLPSLSLGEDGTCGLCAGYRSRKERDAGRPRKKEEFEALVERARKLDRTYDCLIPLSGGKDSTYALYLCEKVYKLKCLCVTFDNGYLAPGALANIQAALAATRADHIMYQVSRAVMLDLYKLFLRKTGAFCPPCLRGIGLAASLAERFRIPLTVAGTGWQVSYLAGVPEVYQEGTVDFFQRVVKGEPIEREVGPLLRAGSAWSLSRVRKVASRLFRMPGLSSQHYVRLYDYFEPDYGKILQILRSEMGWSEGDGSKVEHLDCRIHDVAGYVHRLKFPDLTAHTIHRAGLVRMGKLERAEALSQDERELADGADPEMLSVFCREMGLAPEDFREAAQDWKKIRVFRGKKKGVLRSLYHTLTGQ